MAPHNASDESCWLDIGRKSSAQMRRFSQTILFPIGDPLYFFRWPRRDHGQTGDMMHRPSGG